MPVPLNPDGLLWRHDRREMPKGKSTNVAAPVMKREAPLVLLNLAYLDHSVGTACVGTVRGDDPFRIGVERLLLVSVLDNGIHRTLPLYSLSALHFTNSGVVQKVPTERLWANRPVPSREGHWATLVQDSFTPVRGVHRYDDKDRREQVVWLPIERYPTWYPEGPD